jgi:hypothetical protein
MKTLKIDVPEGYEIDKEQSTFENIVFKEIKKELPKSWEEIENLQGFFVDYSSDIIETADDVEKTEDNRNIFATKEQAKACNALAQLSQLREVYRQGWKPNWENTNQKIWCIYLDKNESKVTSFFDFNRFLSFQSQEIAEQFLENFRDLIEKARPLMS